MLTNRFCSAIIQNVAERKRHNISIGELCNGSTADSDSVCWGSNPYSPVNAKDAFWASFLRLLKKGIGIRTRRARSERKLSGGEFSPTWATSGARR